ncbi:FG-GAP-like repeat-containing protein [Micromonospora vulcania]|uniref:FG-GAP-like repeat-containing protein n=1 Tax=Micromonospora vulcania TaxID=1441873 RepID=A0ABW1GZ25_9ACTN
MTAYRVSCARVIVDDIKRRGLARRAAAIAITTTIVESTIRNLTYGDRDSVGLYQQRPSQGWGTVEQILDPVYATGRFIRKMLEVDPNTWMTDPIGEVCQDVQNSARPSRYYEEASDGTTIAYALWNLSASPTKGNVSDVSGDGHADVLATKPDGTLWYYPNNMDSNPNHVPFVDGTNIGRDWAQFDRVMSADVSGDGHADVLATKPDGTMWYYPNNMDSNPGHLPFTDGTNIGRDWAQFNRVMSADVSGDGHADVLATKPDGTLWYYPNNMDSNPGHLPFTDGTNIGRDWAQYDRVMSADVSGDGHADVLATKPDGTLWYYPNNMDSNPGHLPFTDGTNIGRDWAQFNRVTSADVSGDGHADVLATKPDGTMWYYPNNMDSNPNHVPFVNGTNIGHDWAQYNRIF